MSLKVLQLNFHQTESDHANCVGCRKSTKNLNSKIFKSIKQQITYAIKMYWMWK